MISFTFTRNPSTKVSITIELTGLVPADNTLVIIGHRAATGGTATTDVPVQIENFGDEVAAEAECVALFGAAAEITEMVVAAIKANKFSDIEPKVFPPIVCIAEANATVDLASTLAANITEVMPYVAVSYKLDDATRMGELRDHLTAISASDRGPNGQFGSFGFMGVDVSLAAASAAGEAAGDEVISAAWLRDLNVTKANKIHELAAAYGAICAGLGIPYLPLNEVKIGGLVPPTDKADRHTTGDTGSVALGLESGLTPLQVNSKNEVTISRSVTTRRTEAATADNAYFDIQDWQTLYFFRANVYATSRQDKFKRAKATEARVNLLKSAILSIAKDLEDLEMFQFVEQLADQFTVRRDPTRRDSFIYEAPVNVVPGFMNKGIGIVGTTQFDELL